MTCWEISMLKVYFDFLLWYMYCILFKTIQTVLVHGGIDVRDFYLKQAGFSLVELMVAVFILAIGLLGLAELQLTAIKTNSKSGAITASATVAQMAVEEIMGVKTESHYLYGTMLIVDEEDEPWPDDPSNESLLDGGVVDVDGDGDDDFEVTFTSTTDAVGAGVTDIEITVTSLMGGTLSTMSASGKAFKDLRRVYSD